MHFLFCAEDGYTVTAVTVTAGSVRTGKSPKDLTY